MYSRTKILFIGNYLAGNKGTTALASRLKEKLHNEYSITLISTQKNKLLRLISMLIHSLFHPAQIMVVDVFSGKAFLFALWCTQASSWFKKRKIILVLRGGKLAEHYAERKHDFQKLLKRAHKVVTPSLFLQQEFSASFPTISYLPNFVNLEQFPFQREGRNKYQILWVRSFASIYQPQLAIQIVHALHKKFPEASLTMIGPDDGLLESSKQLATSLKIIHRIQFVGPVNHSQLAAYYHRHGIYLNTTQYESFGNALMEAASSGIPIVSSAVGEIPFLWKHKLTAMLAQQQETSAFVNCIEALWQDTRLTEAICIAARKRSEAFSWEHVEPMWKALLS
ncbi:MAG: glycosyltransferase family 4 protein [Chitinophagaceae bacterium]|nr:glycosyltransferase family 4 protein [Chitinophagaceae bacterium]